MASPSSSLATLRPDLASSMEEFDLDAEAAGYIGMKVLPPIDVASQAGVWGKIPLKELLKNPVTLRQNGSDYNEVTSKFETDSYATEENGIEVPVDDRESAMYREYFDQEMFALRMARAVVLRAYELRCAALVFNTTTWSGSLTNAVSVPWSTAATATPASDVETAVNAIHDRTGIWPNALIISRKKFRQLRNAESIIERINSDGAGRSSTVSDITAQQLAELFDLDYVLVGSGSKNAANEGQTADIDPIWDDTMAMVAKVAVGNDPKEPCIGRTFHWSADGSRMGATVESYRWERQRGNRIRARHDTDEKVMYASLGQLLTSV